MTKEQVNSVLADELGIHKKIHASDRLIEDLGCDSIDLVELTLAFEEEAERDISDKEAESCRTVGDIYKLLGAE